MYKKILNIVTIALFIISILIFGLFALGGLVPGDPLYKEPIYTGTLLTWSYILTCAAIFSAFIFPIIRLFTRPKQAMKSFIGLAVVLVIVLIAYALSDSTPMKINGYTGQDNVPSTLALTDTIIFSMYMLFGGAIVAILATEILKKFR